MWASDVLYMTVGTEFPLAWPMTASASTSLYEPTPQYRPYFPTAAYSTPGPLLMTSWAVSVRLAHLLQKHARSPPAHTVPRARGATEPPLCRCTAANGGA